MSCEHPETTTAQSGIRVCVECGEPVLYADAATEPEPDLISWLGGVLDERERVALAVPENARRWMLDGATVHHGHPTDEVVDWVYVDGAREHIALNDPAQVLAEVDAKRRLLDWIDRTWELAADLDCFAVDREQAYRILALPYADRSGYREEWRP